MKKLFASVLILGILAASSAALAVEFPAFPMSFWGEVSINEKPAATGSVLRAYYGTELAGEVTVNDGGVYGYIKSTKQKLTMAEGMGVISFTIQTPEFNDGNEIGGESYAGFETGETKNQNFFFVHSTQSSGGGGGGGGSTTTKESDPIEAPDECSIGGFNPDEPGSDLTCSKTTPGAHGLTEGNTISATGSNDPDIYIVNEHGYKRLFLNPVIFEFYGHLGGWGEVKSVSDTTRDSFQTTQLFRNCETNAEEVYAVEVTGEDTATLHWLNMTGEQAVEEDADFFMKVFCINNNEFNWYTESGEAYTSLSQVPVYNRNF